MEEKEIFVDIPGYEGLYEVSNLGTVRSIKLRGGYRILKGHQPFKKYAKKISLTDLKGRQTVQSLNAIIYESFIEPLPDNFRIINIDGDINNNKLNNLMKVDISEYKKHNMGRRQLGRSTALIQKQILDDESTDYYYIAAKYNVCHETVRKLKTGQTTPLYKKKLKTNLSKMQIAILKFIKTFQESHGGFSPTLQEIANYFNKTKNFAHLNAKEMKRKGYIAYDANKARTIRIIRELENKNV